MRLHRVQFKHVLSFSTTFLTLDHHVTAIIGPNDAGKTNILRLLHRLAGPTPTLRMPSEVRSWFSLGSEPCIELSFVADLSDRDALIEITGIQPPPSNSFVLKLSCKDGTLELRIENQSRELTQEEGEDVLKRLVYSFFVEPDVRALRPEISFKEVLANESLPEVRLFSLIGLTRDDLNNIYRWSPNGRKAVQQAGDRLTEMVYKIWKQGKLQFSLSLRRGNTVDESALDIMVSDNPDHSEVPLKNRGAGLQWFLALLVQLKDKPLRENSLCTLFLIDEPGVFLHPAGQANLLSMFNELSNDAPNQVIYTTHSPFMLDWSCPHEVRIIERDANALTPASTIVDKPYHSNQPLNFWEPFRRSIGLFVGDMGLLGDKNLLVEGISDQIILSHLRRMTGELSGWRIIPSGTSYACAFLARVCDQANRQVAILVDGDPGGLAYLEVLRKYDCSNISIHN